MTKNSKQSEELGKLPINTLLVKQSVPASIGILVMSIYMIADTIFVGQWVGALAIGAITVVMPITFLISAIGMSIGVGGGSIISRALGANDEKHASIVFGNQITMTLLLSVLAVIPGYYFEKEILQFFGAEGKVLEYASEYFKIVLAGVPFLAWAMMSNNVIRAEGSPRIAMTVMLVPAVVNLILDPLFIKVFGWGMAGAAWATTISYIMSALYAVWFFRFGKSELEIKPENLRLKKKVVAEISSLGSVTLARQGTISILSIILNNALQSYGGEIYLSVYGVINRIMMFALFPVLGLTQGLLPIVGYNYGAGNFDRVKETIRKSLLYGTGIAGVIYVLILVFKTQLVSLFGSDPEMLELTPPAILIVFMATPIITVQLVGSAYFQALGQAIPAFILTLSRQGLVLIPLLIILPKFWGIEGIWYSFPIADVVSAVITAAILRYAMRKEERKLLAAKKME